MDTKTDTNFCMWLCNNVLCAEILPEFEAVKDAVVKHGSNKWYEIGLKLGLNENEIRNSTYNIPTEDGRLLAVIEAKKTKVGKNITAKDLLRACHQIPTPIDKQVEGELKKGKCHLNVNV